MSEEWPSPEALAQYQPVPLRSFEATVRDAVATLKVGDRVRLARDVERYPHFIAEAGRTGRITYVDAYNVCAVMDLPLPGSEEWANEVCWSDADFFAFFDDVEVNP